MTCDVEGQTMLGKASSTGDLHALDRRSFMKVTGVAAAAGILSSAGVDVAHAAALTRRSATS
jgi:hypothetical protein